MKYLKSILIAIMAFSSTVLIANPTFFLKIEEISSTETDCVLEISMAGSQAMALGSSNLQFFFNETHIANPTLVSTTLGPGYQVTVTKPSASKASMNIDLLIPDAGHGVEAFPAWTVLGQIHFDVLDQFDADEITWSYSGTTTETVVYIDDEATQIFVGDPDNDLTGVLHGTLVAVPELPENGEITVFPNPFVDNINLKRTETAESALQISLIDPQGKTLNIWKFPANDLVFPIEDVGHLPPGPYYIQLGSEESHVGYKVIKF